MTQEDYDGYVDAARSMVPGTFLAVGNELMTYTLPAQAGSSPTRVLALAGSRKQPLIRRSLSLISATFPHSAARIAPGVGHAWNGQAPELFAAAVRAQITDSALPAGLLPADDAD